MAPQLGAGAINGGEIRRELVQIDTGVVHVIPPSVKLWLMNKFNFLLIGNIKSLKPTL